MGEKTRRPQGPDEVAHAVTSPSHRFVVGFTPVELDEGVVLRIGRLDEKKIGVDCSLELQSRALGGVLIGKGSLDLVRLEHLVDHVVERVQNNCGEVHHDHNLVPRECVGVKFHQVTKAQVGRCIRLEVRV